MSRITPFDLAFGGELERRFETAQAEAAASRKDATDVAQFVSLPSVQKILGVMESPELLAEDPGAATQYHLLAYAAFQFWCTGKKVFPVSRDALTADAWNEDESLSTVRPPGGACYLQLPERWIWAQVEADAPHEPLDGVFVAQSSDGKQLCFVAVLGLRADRAGFSQISASVAPRELAALPAVVHRPYFEPAMDGGRDAGFKSVNSIGELLLLSLLALAHVQS